MKQIPTAMQKDLDNGATHHCFCWQITRSDGLTFGFTDHDRDLEFDSTTFVAETGLVPSAIETGIGLNVDNMDVMGILNSISIDEQDLARGLYDNATVTSYRVDWKNLSNRIVMLKGHIGEVSRGNLGFTAEIRSVAHELNQKIGQSYKLTCRADLGDTACGFNLSGVSSLGHLYKVNSTVTYTNTNSFFYVQTAEFETLPDAWFDRGLIRWTSGDNTGLEMEVRAHNKLNALSSVVLWEPMPSQIQVGDAFEIQAGCDKSAAVCKSKFDNIINFRGFNLIPGNDAVLRAAVQGEDNDGGSIF